MRGCKQPWGEGFFFGHQTRIESEEEEEEEERERLSAVCTYGLSLLCVITVIDT